MRMLISVLSVALTACPAEAQTPKAKCQALAESFGTGARSVRNTYEAVKELPLGAAAYEVDGQEKAAINDLAAKRRELLPAMKIFVDQMSDTAYVLEKCSR